MTQLTEHVPAGGVVKSLAPHEAIAALAKLYLQVNAVQRGSVHERLANLLFEDLKEWVRTGKVQNRQKRYRLDELVQTVDTSEQEGVLNNVSQTLRRLSAAIVQFGDRLSSRVRRNERHEDECELEDRAAAVERTATGPVRDAIRVGINVDRCTFLVNGEWRVVHVIGPTKTLRCDDDPLYWLDVLFEESAGPSTKSVAAAQNGGTGNPTIEGSFMIPSAVPGTSILPTLYCLNLALTRCAPEFDKHEIEQELLGYADAIILNLIGSGRRLVPTPSSEVSAYETIQQVEVGGQLMPLAFVERDEQVTDDGVEVSFVLSVKICRNDRVDLIRRAVIAVPDDTLDSLAFIISLEGEWPASGLAASIDAVLRSRYTLIQAHDFGLLFHVAAHLQMRVFAFGNILQLELYRRADAAAMTLFECVDEFDLAEFVSWLIGGVFREARSRKVPWKTHSSPKLDQS